MSDKCSICKKKVHSGIKCDYCNKWYHKDCEKISEEEYDLLKSPRFPWYCTICYPKAMDVVKFIGSIREEHEQMKKRLENAEKKLEKLDQVETEVKDITDNFTTKVKESIHELKQRDDKAKNIVVSNMPERPSSSDTEDEEEGDTDPGEDTKKLVNELIKEGMGLKDVKVIKAKRIPEKRTEGGKPRIIVAELREKEQKFTVLKSSKKLRDTQNPMWKNVYVNPDMTKQQRHKDFQLRQELKRRREEGENDLIIRNGVIIQKESASGNEKVPPEDTVK